MCYFPNSRCRMDLVLVPLRIELWARLVVEIELGVVSINEELINKLLWNWQAKAINANIFNVGDLEPDKTPPDFAMFTKAVSMPHKHFSMIHL